MEFTPANLFRSVIVVVLGFLPLAPQPAPAHPASPHTVTAPLEHCEMFPEACAWDDACHTAAIPLTCGQSLSLAVGEDPVAATSLEPCSGQIIPSEDVFVLAVTLDDPQLVTFTATSDPPGAASLDLIGGCYTMACPPDVERNAQGALSADLDPGSWILVIRGLADGVSAVSIRASCGTVPVRKLSWGLIKSRYASQ